MFEAYDHKKPIKIPDGVRIAWSHTQDVPDGKTDGGIMPWDEQHVEINSSANNFKEEYVNVAISIKKPNHCASL